MSDPVDALQRAIVTQLKADALVGALIGDKVYDRVPPDAAEPYVSFGPRQSISDDALCLDAYEVFFQIDCWSRAVGQSEVQTVAGAVRAALRDAEFGLTGFNLVEIRHVTTRYLTEPDGLTNHAAMTFRALIDTADTT